MKFPKFSKHGEFDLQVDADVMKMHILLHLGFLLNAYFIAFNKYH